MATTITDTNSSDRDDLADWMSQLPSACHDLPLNALAIPGSHNCFSSQLNAGDIGPDCPETIKVALKIFGSAAKEIILKWSTTQSVTLSQQLKMGIRYFDFRVAYNDSTNKLHFVHGLFGPEVELCMQEMHLFLEDHKKEIIILDFNHFYNMDLKIHEQLLSVLLDIFEEKMCPFVGTNSITLNMLWTNNLQVVICYHHNLALQQSMFWPGSTLKSLWANTDNVCKLIDTLKCEYERGHSEEIFYNWQGVLTPGAGTIISHLNGSLKSILAENANSAVINWIKDKFPSSSGLNIISTDFVHLNDFIPKVIQMNEKYK